MSALESAGSLLDDSQRGDSQQVKEGSSETLSTVAASEAIEEEALDDTVERRIKQPHALGDHGQWPDSTTVAADVGAVNIPSGECTPPSGGGGNGGEVVESSIKRINDNIDNIIAAVASNATAVTPEQQQQHAHHHQEEQQQHQSSDTLLFDDAASATNNNDMMTMINLQPDTTLSLDQEETVSDLEKSPEPETNKNRRYNALMMNDDEVSARVDPDDPNNNNKNTNEDSSDDDSSYFADPSHLPKPKSERRYSWSSNNSATAAAAAPSSLNTTHPISNGGSATAALTNSPRHHSQHNHHHHHQRNHSITAASVGRESDASLSLSDDSEDEGLGDHDPHQPPAMFPSHPPMDQQQQQQPHFVYPPVQQQQQQHYVYSHQQPPQLQGQPFPQQQQQPAILYEHQQKQHQFIMPPRGGVPELYPEQIMPRMHSVSSLVSTSSQNSSSSDTSVKDELRNVAIHRESHQGGPLEQQQRVVGRNAPQQPQQHIPSGRLVPILGEHPPSRSGGGGTTPIGRLFLGSPSTVNQRPSPPPISQTYSGDGHITHPQPMTAEQLATWVELSTSTPPSLSSSSKRQHNQQPMISSYTTSVFEDQQRVGDTTKSRNIYSAGSAYSRDSDLVYSGDSDVQQQQRQSSNSKARGEPQGVKNKTLHGSTNLPPSRRSLGDINVSSRSIDGKGFTLYWQRWLMLMVSSSSQRISYVSCRILFLILTFCQKISICLF